MKPIHGRRRVVIEGVQPEIDGGRFPIKRCVGETVVVEADVFADGHDVLASELRYRREGDERWAEVPMESLPNDRWRGRFTVTDGGRYRYTIRGWVDRFATWRRGLAAKVQAEQEVSVDLLVGADLVEQTARRARGPDGTELRMWAKRLRDNGPEAAGAALDEALAELMAAHPDRRSATAYGRELVVVVDRERAGFSSWYELFPRSASPVPGRPGTLADVVERLPYVAAMGFDVLYLPPIHPIGRSFRKGPNNTEQSGPEDPGSPWAIGSEEGGHTAVDRSLGTLKDFDRLVKSARKLGIEVALDLAFQCSPDHPWVREHPEWFRHRPDGSIQYAENPPKRYQDIFPIDFETEDWQALWNELRRVVEFWIGHGVRIFRVDNPHTKPFAFWEWLITELKAEQPDLIFLSEAFTRPKVMNRLAKLGFTQSYTYFTWRTTKWELTQYFTELTRTEAAEYFRPHLWPNTPDILTEQLQQGGRPAFVQRLVLAATLGANYGIYGPAYELMEHRPLREGSEEYFGSEKYEIRHWDLARPDSLSDLIARVNRIRHENPALQTDRTLRFHDIDNDALIAYSKRAANGSDFILVVVNLDPHHVQAGWVQLPLDQLGIEPGRRFQVHDLLTDARYQWQGERNFVELDPRVVPAHIMRVRRRLRTEADFEYFL
jgi:starch synthase (maltosyl-transferring)